MLLAAAAPAVRNSTFSRSESNLGKDAGLDCLKHQECGKSNHPEPDRHEHDVLKVGQDKHNQTAQCTRDSTEKAAQSFLVAGAACVPGDRSPIGLIRKFT